MSQPQAYAWTQEQMNQMQQQLVCFPIFNLTYVFCLKILPCYGDYEINIYWFVILPINALCWIHRHVAHMPGICNLCSFVLLVRFEFAAFGIPFVLEAIALESYPTSSGKYRVVFVLSLAIQTVKWPFQCHPNQSMYLIMYWLTSLVQLIECISLPQFNLYSLCKWQSFVMHIIITPVLYTNIYTAWSFVCCDVLLIAWNHKKMYWVIMIEKVVFWNSFIFHPVGSLNWSVVVRDVLVTHRNMMFLKQFMLRTCFGYCLLNCLMLFSGMHCFFLTKFYFSRILMRMTSFDARTQ